MNAKRYIWGAVIAAALSVPATLIGAFIYLFLRPLERAQSVLQTAEFSVVFGFAAAIRETPLAAACGAIITFAIVRTPAVVSVLVAGVLCGACAGISWWLSTRASAAIVARAISPTMAAVWGTTAIVATSVAIQRLNRQHNPGIKP